MASIRSLFSPLLDRLHIFVFCVLLVTVGLGAGAYIPPTASVPITTHKVQVANNPATGSTNALQPGNSNSPVFAPSTGSSGLYEDQDSLNEPEPSTSIAPEASLPPPPPTSPDAQPTTPACTGDSCSDTSSTTDSSPCGSCGSATTSPHPQRMCPMYCTRSEE